MSGLNGSVRATAGARCTGEVWRDQVPGTCGVTLEACASRMSDCCSGCTHTHERRHLRRAKERSARAAELERVSERYNGAESGA